MKLQTKINREREEGSQGKGIWISLFTIWLCMFFVAVSIVCFLAPVLSEIGDWIEGNFKRQVYFFFGMLVVAAGFFLYQFKKRYF